MDEKKNEDSEKSKMSTLMKVGIIVLIVIGVPLILFGTCILIINSSF